MAEPRDLPRATLLPDGRVLVTGGIRSGMPVPGPAELYDAGTGTFTGTGTMLTERYGHAASLLPSGKVLVTGGHDGVSEIHGAELYGP